MPTTTPVDLSDSTLWQNGFPEDLFADLRRDRPIFHHELTDGVAKTVKRDFWMTTKRPESVADAHRSMLRHPGWPLLSTTYLARIDRNASASDESKTIVTMVSSTSSAIAAP